MGRLKRGFRRQRIGFCGLRRSLVRIHVGGGLHIFELREHLTLPDAISLSDEKVRILTESVGSDIYIRLRLNLSGSTHHCGEIFALRLRRRSIFAALMDGDTDDGCQQHEGTGANSQFSSKSSSGFAATRALPFCSSAKLEPVSRLGMNSTRVPKQRKHIVRYDPAGAKVPRDVADKSECGE